MSKYDQFFIRLGFSEAERDIYLSLLATPNQLVSDIARHTRYHRPTIYRALTSLEAGGYIGRMQLEGKRYYYHVHSPELLHTRLQSLQSTADQFISELRELYDRTEDIPKLSIREGVDGIRQIHMDLINSLPMGGIYYRYSSSDKEYGQRFHYVSDEYFDLQRSKHIERCVISNEARKKDHSGNPNRDIVAIPSGFDLFDENITKIIYSNKVSIIDYNAQIGWTIESERFARYEEKIFRLLHKLLKNQQ